MGDHLKCPDCNGTTFTASGNDCATCNGTGLLDEPLPAAPAPTPVPGGGSEGGTPIIGAIDVTWHVRNGKAVGTPAPDPRGLHRKYRVERTDGSSAPGGKHADCAYFVLDRTHDVYAVPALRAYANACEAESPALAADLRAGLPIATPDPRDAEIERLRERNAALEAALKETARFDHGEDCHGRYDEHGDVADEDEADEHCDCGLGPARNAIAGGTSALDAVRAEDKARIAALEAQVADGLARAERFAAYVDAVTPLTGESNSLPPAQAFDKVFSAALADQKTRVLDGVKAKVEAMRPTDEERIESSYEDQRDGILQDVLAAIEAAREGT